MRPVLIIGALILGSGAAQAASDLTFPIGPGSETLVVLDDVQLTVSIEWQEDGKDSVMLVTKPDAVASTMANTDLIGNCADLLNTQTNEN